jgi:hypothetical protein
MQRKADALRGGGLAGLVQRVQQGRRIAHELTGQLREVLGPGAIGGVLDHLGDAAILPAGDHRPVLAGFQDHEVLPPTLETAQGTQRQTERRRRVAAWLAKLNGDLRLGQANRQPGGTGLERDLGRLQAMGAGHAAAQDRPELPCQQTRNLDQGSPAFLLPG